MAICMLVCWDVYLNAWPRLFVCRYWMALRSH